MAILAHTIHWVGQDAYTEFCTAFCTKDWSQKVEIIYLAGSGQIDIRTVYPFSLGNAEIAELNELLWQYFGESIPENKYKRPDNL